MHSWLANSCGNTLEQSGRRNEDEILDDFPMLEREDIREALSYAAALVNERGQLGLVIFQNAVKYA